METRKANQIETWLKKMGLEVSRKSSGVSNAEYLTVSKRVTDDHEGNGDPIEGKIEYRIRVSEYALPLTYHLINIVDFEVSRNGIHDDRHSTQWFDAVIWIANEFGIEVPSRIKGFKTRQRKEAAKLKARMQHWQQQVKTKREQVEQDRRARTKEQEKPDDG